MGSFGQHLGLESPGNSEESEEESQYDSESDQESEDTDESEEGNVVSLGRYLTANLGDAPSSDEDSVSGDSEEEPPSTTGSPPGLCYSSKFSDSEEEEVEGPPHCRVQCPRCGGAGSIPGPPQARAH